MLTLKIIDDDGKERTIENVLDYSVWTKDDIDTYTEGEEFFDSEMKSITEKLSAKLRKLEEFADTFMFKDCLRETLYELKSKKKQQWWIIREPVKGVNYVWKRSRKVYK